MRPEASTDDLAPLLAEERAAILAGDWPRLDALLPRKEAALQALAERGPSPWQGLRAEVARNQALLAAAIEGVREAARRRAELRQARSRLSTYDAQGARAETTARPRIERRA